MAALTCSFELVPGSRRIIFQTLESLLLSIRQHPIAVEQGLGRPCSISENSTVRNWTTLGH